MNSNPFDLTGQLPYYEGSYGRFNENDEPWLPPENVNPFAQQQQQFWTQQPSPFAMPPQVPQQPPLRLMAPSVQPEGFVPKAPHNLSPAPYEYPSYAKEQEQQNTSLRQMGMHPSSMPVLGGHILDAASAFTGYDYAKAALSGKLTEDEQRKYVEEMAVLAPLGARGIVNAGRRTLTPEMAARAREFLQSEEGSITYPINSLFKYLQYSPQEISNLEMRATGRVRARLGGRPPTQEQIESEIRSFIKEEAGIGDIAPATPKLTPDILMQEYKAGKTPTQIAEQYDTTPASVSARMAELRRTRPEETADIPAAKSWRPSVLTPEKIRSLEKMIDDGHTYDDLVERLRPEWPTITKASLAVTVSNLRQAGKMKRKGGPDIVADVAEKQEPSVSPASNEWENELQKELIGNYYYLMRPENNPRFNYELKGARTAKQSAGVPFTETGPSSDYYKIWKKHESQVRRFLNLPQDVALPEAIGQERKILAGQISAEDARQLQKEYYDFVTKPKPLTVRDSPEFKRDIQAWMDANEGEPVPSDIAHRIYAKHQARHKRTKDRGFSSPYDKTVRGNRYADGGPVDWGDTPVNVSASPTDWGDTPVDQEWRGYPTVIGSGLAQGAITGVGKALQGIPELYADKPEDTALARAGRSIEQFGKETFPLKPQEEKSISGQVATTIGTVLPVIAGGVATPALGASAGVAGLAATVVGAAQMGLMSAAEQAARARQAGANVQTAREAAIWGAAGNALLGVVPFHMILKPLERASPAMKDWAIAKLKAAGQSGVTFGGIGEVQHWLGEKIAQEFYDPKAGYHPDAERAMVGLISGAVLGGARRVPVREEPRAGAEIPERGPEARPVVEPQGDQVSRLLAGENTQLRQQEAVERQRTAEREQTEALIAERAQVEQAAPEQSRPTQSAEIPPVTLARPQELTLDPQRFRATISEPPTPGVEKKATTPILAFADEAGNTTVVNGNRRVEAAQIQGLEQIPARIMRQADGVTPEFARAVGAYQNLFEGARSPAEADRIVRSNTAGISERLGGVPDASRLVQDANALSSISPQGFGLVTKGAVPPAFAAEIARQVRDQVAQVRALEAVSKAQPTNIDQVRKIVQDTLAVRPPQERATNENLLKTLQAEAGGQRQEQGQLPQAAQRIGSERSGMGQTPTRAAAVPTLPAIRPGALAGSKLEGVQRRAIAGGDRPAEQASARPAPADTAARGVASLPSLTPAAMAKRKRIEGLLTKLVEQQVGKHVKIKFSNKIKIDEGPTGYGGAFGGEKTAAGLYHPAERIIEIALADKRFPDVSRTALHEPFHAVQDLLATPAELRILKREDARLREIARRELNLTPEQAKDMSSVEVQAAAYDAWARHKVRGVPLPPLVTRLYNNIRDFLRKVGNGLRGLGFRSADDIFQSTFEGGMVNRQAREPGRFVDEATGNTSVFPSVAPVNPAGSHGPIVPTPKPTDTLGPIAKKFSNLIDKIGLGDAVRDIQMKLSPMAARDATIESRAAAKDFANGIQEAKYTRVELDDYTVKNFTPEQQKRMWEAADAESVAIQTGKPTNKGLASLTVKEREFVERMQKRADEVFNEAKRLGIYEGDEKLPSYVTRLVLLNKGGGKFERPSFNKIRSLDSIGGKLRTTTAQMIERKYLTVEETETAAKAKLGPEAEVLKNIRVLPYATGLLQEAIAGRKLIERIKEAGKEAGIPTVAAGEKPQGNWFTIDHPAFYNTRETADGSVSRTPIFVRSDFEGPLRSVLEQGNGSKIYQAMMALKGKTMSVVMMSPMIHNQVEWGRALPAMPGKVLTGRIYFEGNTAKHDPTIMREAIRGGLVPIGHRGYLQDITSVQEAPRLGPRNSWTSQILAAVPGLFSKSAGDAVKRTVDKMGDFWHNTLLWDRIGDLQMGLYVNLRDHLIKKGYDPLTSQRAAAHWANRYAGAIPIEAMSANARKIANLMMFSRSFTLGNIGVMKDSYSGLPRDVQAQIARDSGFEALRRIKGEARRKATAILMIDIGLFYVLNSLLQSAINTIGSGQTAATLGGALAGTVGGSMIAGPAGAFVSGLLGGYGGFQATSSTGPRTLDEEIQTYKDRFNSLLNRLKEHPIEILDVNKNLERVSSTSENEPGKKDRVRFGKQDDGTNLFMRFAPGKIGEEFIRWPTSPKDMAERKLSTWAKPLSELWKNQNFQGDSIYYKNAEGLNDTVRNTGLITWHIMKSQIPLDWMKSLYDLESGHGDKTTNLLKSVAPLVGTSVSKGAPTGELYGEVLRQRERIKFEVGQNREDIKRLIVDKKYDEAIKRMQELKFDAHEMQTFMKLYSGAPRVRANMAKKFEFKGTPEEIDEFRRHQQRSLPPAAPSSPNDWGDTPVRP